MTFRRLVGAVVAHVLKALGGNLRPEDVVDKLVGRLRVRGLGGDKGSNDAKAHPLLGVDHPEVRVLELRQGHLGGVHHRSPYLSAEKVVLEVVVFNKADVGGQLQQLLAGGLDDGGVLGVVAFPHHLQGHAVYHPVVANHRQVILQGGVPQVGVAGNLLLNPGGVVDNGLHSGAVGDGVLVIGVEELPLIYRVDVPPAGELFGVQLLGQPLGNYRFDDVVVGDDHIVVPAACRLQPGQHILVGIKVRVVDGDAGLLGERLQHLRGEHPLPGVEGHGPAAGGLAAPHCQCQDQNQGQSRREDLLHRSYLLLSHFFLCFISLTRPTSGAGRSTGKEAPAGW